MQPFHLFFSGKNFGKIFTRHSSKRLFQRLNCQKIIHITLDPENAQFWLFLISNKLFAFLNKFFKVIKEYSSTISIWES